MTGDIALYQSLKGVEVNVDLNGGTMTEASLRIKPYEKDQLLPVAEKEGYDFLGWSETGSDSADYEKGDKIAISKDTTLYAIWKKKEQPNRTTDLDTFKKTEEKVKEWFIVTDGDNFLKLSDEDQNELILSMIRLYVDNLKNEK